MRLRYTGQAPHAHSEDQIGVKTTANTVGKEMKLELTGGVNSERDWKGDVKNMLLDISKIKKLGWKPKHNSKQTVRRTIKEYTQNKRAWLFLNSFGRVLVPLALLAKHI